MQRLALFCFLWLAAGYLVGLAANSLAPLPITAWQVSIAGLFVGLVWLAIITRKEYGRRMFYEGPAEWEEGIFAIGCMWGVPFTLGSIAFVVWVVFSVF